MPFRYGKAGGQKSLEERFRHAFAKAQDFACGLHFRAEYGVGIAELFKGEDRHLYRHIGRRTVKPGAKA